MPPRRQRPRESPALVAFGRQMRRLREAKGIKQETIGHLTTVSGPQVSRIEAGKKRATRPFVEIVDDHLDAGGSLISLWEDLNKDGHPVPLWFDWPKIEEDATELITWEHTIVPGLLQNEAYARAFLGVDEAIEARIARQSVLTRDDPPPVALTALLSEAVLYHLVGSPEVMHEQLTHLVALSELPNVTIQMVRNNGRPAGTGGAFVVATMEDRSEVAYLEMVVRGITTDDPSDLAKLSEVLRELRARAFPEDMSRDVMRKALEKWT
ncbi:MULTISPECIES: helix-turn-helix domain-containing protein [Thermomonosporaceae]|uniref:helix-turn-helix domain-containing protein n=1 Tax=Thermomonosporaceae TaxID=2012 RepID=UPI00255AD39A|nr:MULTISPECIES: helix-turn-helix transcriptional regulator [Thermomonosporaceae]MDL4775302.1 helix-turn-helix transcriptional regulator [Actinomadura xylanilytica]